MRNIDEAERTFGVSLTTRDDWLQIHGDTDSVDKVSALFKLLETARQHGIQIRSSDFHHTLRAVAQDRVEELEELYKKPLVIKLKRKSIIPKTLNQKRYLQSIAKHPVTLVLALQERKNPTSPWPWH